MTPRDQRAEVGPAPGRDALADPARVAAVERLIALGPAGPLVDRLTSVAAQVLHAPFAQVSLLGADEQTVAAVHGLELSPERRRGPMEDSLCTVTAAYGRPLVVDDARSHPWVADLPPVTSGAVGSYLGVLLRDSGGHVLGSLCVYDAERRRWSDSDVDGLTALAGAVSIELEQHARTSSTSAVRMELAAAAADLGSYDYDLATGQLSWDSRMVAMHGLSPGAFRGSIESFDAVVHPDDLPAIRDAMAHAVEVVGDLVLDYRVVLPDGGHRWIKARGRVLPDVVGSAARILGAAYDSSADRGLRDELTRLLETMPAAFVRSDRDWTITYVNAVAESVFRRTRHELVGRDLWEAFPEAKGTEFQATYERVRATGEPEVLQAWFEPLAAHFEVHVWPDDGGLSFFLHDVSDRKRSQLALEQASDRLTVLASAGARLSASLHPAEVLEVLADLIVPDLACSLVLAVVGDVAELLGLLGSSDPTRLHPVHVAHADAHLHEVLTSVIAPMSLSTTAASGVGRAVRTGAVQALDRVSDELVAERATDDDHARRIQLLNTGPTLSVPLRSPSGVLGAFTVGGSSDTPLDELLLTDLGARAAVALDNALAFARQNRAATDLQSALLPRDAPSVPEVQVATRYLPASTGALAGGDFFKTVLVDGRLVTVIGDVMGHGTASAARAGQLHSLVAALALEGHSPGALLERLGAGVHQMMDLELATLLVCSYDPAARTLTTACAGHPAPLFAPVVGQPYYLDVEPGPPVGVAASAYDEVRCDLERGATMVLFTDGLVERRGESIADGLERLRQAVDELRLPPEAVADHILRELGRSAGGDDDVALLVLSHV